VGEHASEIRAAGVQGAAAAGALLDEHRNAALDDEGRISEDRSQVAVYVIAAREGWQLARAAFTAP
jgi:acetate kinase